MHEEDRFKEHFWSIGLNTKNKILYVELVSLGNLNKSIATGREVFRTAIIKNAAFIIIMHNHPSGDLEPSDEDIYLTKTLLEGKRLLDIALLDHIIIGTTPEDGYYSFKSKNLM